MHSNNNSIFFCFKWDRICSQRESIVRSNKLMQSFSAQCPQCMAFGLYFDSKIRRNHRKNFPWAPCLWVRSRKECIGGRIPKMDGKQNSCIEGLVNLSTISSLSMDCKHVSLKYHPNDYRSLGYSPVVDVRPLIF